MCEREIARLAGLSARLDRSSCAYAREASDGAFKPHEDERIESQRLEL